jgi:D-lyxose ketol-isomerase
MKRSEINNAWKRATACFARHGWSLPPASRWDITDLGLGHYARTGLALVNLAEEPEYCEKLMYAWRGQTTPLHMHRRKKEDIICRAGTLLIEVWAGHPGTTPRGVPVRIKRNGCHTEVRSGDALRLGPGERVTMGPGVYHAFRPESDECVISEISTSNDDAHDNFFADPAIGRFPEIEEDEPALIRLVGETATQA